MNLKCGLEIHQRLATKTKLFCACPAKALEQEAPSGEIRRLLRAVYGELGEVDPAAEFEGSRKRSFTYQIFPSSCCLVEMDEEPPAEINKEALEAAIEISLLLGARVLDEIHTMRKTVVDGSATSAFQRTALVAVDGKLETSFGTVGIPTICLEEESCGIVEKKAYGEVVYRLDRLGIPLIEIATGPSIKSGSQAREAAEKIGLLLRSAGRAQRGIGSIRQDLNVSIEGGARVEIKGAQELAAIGQLVENEAARQGKLLEVKEALGKRPFEKGIARGADVSKLLLQTQCTFVSRGLNEGKSALGIKLRGMRGLLGFELLEGHRLGTELSDYAKAFAGVTGIIHCDEDLAKYGFSASEIASLEKTLECGDLDGWALCVGEKNSAEKALDAVFKRAQAARTGVPKETRRAEGEKSRFMRPLPGAARMYPETDVPPITITAETVEKISSKLPETFEQKTQRLRDIGLGEQLAQELSRSEWSGKFAEIALKTRADPTLIAVTLLQTITALSRQGIAVGKIPQVELENALSACQQGQIVKSALPIALEEIAAGNTFQKAVEKKGIEKITGKKLLQIVQAAARQEQANGEVGQKRLLASLIAKYRLQVDPAELSSIVAPLGKHFKHAGVNK